MLFYGVPQAPDMGQYLRGLDWSPNNAFNATQQMQTAMEQYGWTPDQVGAELGFTGDQIIAHLNKYGSMGGYQPINAPSPTYDTGASFGGAPVQQAPQAPNIGGPGGLGGAYQPGIANDPMGGGSVGANPYMSGQIDYLSDVMGRALQQNLQGIRSNAVGTGNLGSSRQGIAEGEAFRGFADALAGNVANMLGQNYQFDRSLNTGSYNTNRALDLQQAGLGLTAMNQGLGMQWSPLQNANSIYTPYTGLGSQSTPSQGGGWQGALGSGISTAALLAQLGLFK